ncbi:uncharacterized protein LACBIDRAFT_330859 [Laccaria bicolor S238N-H82]|uniref:Predicted protein n=1 Tax=Laccaria bicolor (strain S238N-H82 / ATCC MYA-4686) TaxID=486041 RepID=B0DMZ7_LACBS|nr:uncharacterized protein LACBIDRAFT_330859 [Laccaria bicolor S238N-H82]EDR03963.1 predicted protein [Laccaria bicolor S238N-H82]|eukprot:XP_001885218.1 predicted protein [Laccaria bicolor S238N-H82]
MCSRYCNMDYILLSALAPLLVAAVFVSYDIACQFKLKFAKHIPKLPAAIHLPSSIAVEWGIPKCHCPMHKVPCQAPHSLNFKSGVGRTDGKGIEQSWAELNRVANSTKEMGPGSRHDMLDDHLGHHNFRKYVALGTLSLHLATHLVQPFDLGQTLHTRLLLAIPEQKRQQSIFEDFSASLAEKGGLEKEWTQMILDWEKDPKKKNPYLSVVSHASQDEVKKQLLEEEKKQAAAGMPQLHDTGPTSFLSMGLIIEESQHRIIWDSRNPAELTIRQENELQRRRLLLQREIKRFRNLQALYMPAATVMSVEHESIQRELPETQRDSIEPEHQPLWLPSALPSAQRTHNCSTVLVDIEIKLCKAQCHDILDKIRNVQRGRLAFIGFRNRNIRGQNPNTRAKDTLDRLEDKTKSLAVKYRNSRKALLELLGPGEWEKTLRKLSKGDLTTPDGEEISIYDPNDPVGLDGRERSKKQRKIDKLGLGQGKKTVSWIWMSADAIGDGSDAELHEAVHIEWAKARARFLRWTEEVMLLKEEMRRVRKTLEWRAMWWEQRREGWESQDGAMREGIRAYATRQAGIQRGLCLRSTRLWDKPLVPFGSQEESNEGPGSALDPLLESLVEEDE